MGRFFKYVVLLSNVSLILGIQNFKDVSHATSYEGTNLKNTTFRGVVKDYFIKNESEAVVKKEIPNQERRSLQVQNYGSKPIRPLTTLGLSSYESDLPQVTRRRYHSPPPLWRNGIHNPRHGRGSFPTRSFIPPHSQELFPAKNYKKSLNNNVFGKSIPFNNKNSKLVLISGKNFSHGHGHHFNDAQGSESYNFYKSYNGGRNSRFYRPRHNSKVCDPCNSVPWVPLLKVPNSYRQERNHHFGSHYKPESSDFESDYHPQPSNTQDFVLPSSPLVPPTPAVLDGTISSSFGLPVGNIPTAHGMLAPINHYAPQFNKYHDETPAFSNVLPYVSSQSILGSSPIPHLSPVPIVPVYDSGQFYSGNVFGTTNIGLVPPTVSPVAVSNVVFTISEENTPNLEAQKQQHLNPAGVSTNLETNIHFNHNTGVDLLPHDHNKAQEVNTHGQSFNGIEIVKSVPVAEFTTTSSEGFHQSVGIAANVLQQESLSNSHVHQDALQQQNPSDSQINQNVLQPESLSNSHIHQNVIQQESLSNSQIHQNVLQPESLSNSHDFQNNFQKGSLSESHVDQNVLDNDPSAYLVPPPPAFFNLSETSNSEHFRTSSILQPNNYQPTSGTTFTKSVESASWLYVDRPNPPKDLKSPLDPLVSDSQEIAAIVNNEFRSVSNLPITGPDLPKPETTKTKKIQIIIPYTTKIKDSHEPNSLESVRHEVYQTLQALSNKSVAEYESRRDRLSSSLSGNSQSNTNNSSNEKSTNTNSKTTHLERNSKYVTEMQHILAKNIKELLSREIEPVHTVQNYPLQNNIDNWTALEYSNHKTVGNKEPQEIIAQALSVTSIPGTSMSHSLLPSKKIPNEYLVTTPIPVFDQTFKTLIKVSNVSVNSRPFTAKPYATTSRSVISPLVTPPTEKNLISTTTIDKNYTVSGKSRVNYWGKANENLIGGEVKSTTKNFPETTLDIQTSKTPVFSRATEKLEIVTPVSVTTAKILRTTRHIQTTERTIFNRTLLRQHFRTKSIFPRKSLNKTEKPKKKESTKLEEIPHLFFESKKISSLPKNSSSNNSVAVKAEVKSFENVSESKVKTFFNTSSTPLKNETSEKSEKLEKTEEIDDLSINDVFPFRNKELPWESKRNDTLENVVRQRKSLIKQVKLRRPRNPILRTTRVKDSQTGT